MICSIEDVKPNPAMAIQYIITNTDSHGAK